MKTLTKIFVMCGIIIIFLTAQSCSLLLNKQISGPNGKITVKFNISKEKEAFYSIFYEEVEVLSSSKLGIIMEDADFSKNLKLASVSEIELIEDNYEMLHGKQKKINYSANKKVFHLLNGAGKKMDVIFQVSDDGVAFRYYFPGEANEIKKISREITEFGFKDSTKAWVQPMSGAKTGWCKVNPSYEEFYYKEKLVSELPNLKPGWVFPALFKYDKYWMAISETAPDRNYCGCRLMHPDSLNIMLIGFPDEREVFTDRNAFPESTLPWYTPWRIIALGDNLGTIAESTLGTDLSAPSKLKNISFVKPGRSSWSWVLLKDNFTIYEVQKEFIDYASEMSWEYCLVDADWDQKIGYEKAKELVDYAASKNVGILLWYNSSGDWNTTVYSPKSKLITSESRAEEFAKLQEMGVKGVKVDFFGGDGQSMMAYYQEIFEDAAKYGLMVNCHGSTLPRGWQRTYPNNVTMEGIKGFEFVTFEQQNANEQPAHCCVIPFTRNVFDPMDFTPVCFSEVPYINRITSNSFELALSAIFLSGIQHYAEIPKGMKIVPDYVIQMMREIPVDWDETRFIDGYPGKLVIIARRKGATWFIAGINGENIEKTVSFELPFLDDNQLGILIADGEDNRSFIKKDVIWTPGHANKIKLLGNGGFLMKF